MAFLNPQGMAAIKEQNPTLYRVLKEMVDSGNNVAQQVNADPTAQIPQPQAHAGATIKAGAGVIDAEITDNSPQYRGLTHHMDVCQDASFSSFYTVSEGPSKNIRRQFPPAKYHVRTYSQYPTGAPSPFLYHGMIDATGDTQPAMQNGTNQVGFGTHPYNTVQPPKRG